MSESAQLHPKSAREGDLVQIVLVEKLAVFIAFQQVPAGLLFVPAQQVFQLLQIIRPAESVEEFRAGELGFVEGVLRVTGP